MIESGRIKKLNGKDINRKGAYGLYFMQASQRIKDNKALALAVSMANDNNIPLITVFNLMPDFPGANIRHYLFMLQGLRELKSEFENRGLPFEIIPGFYEENHLELSKQAAFTVTDCGYLRHQREMREKAAAGSDCAFYQVETDIVVPCETASQKKEAYASSIRPKILRHLSSFLKETPVPELKKKKNPLKLKGLDIKDSKTVLSFLKCPMQPGPVEGLKGGYSKALELLNIFISSKLPFYHMRSDPSCDFSSGLSPYLHFGQISPAEIALAAMKSAAPQENKEKFLDELIVWRELARNFVLYEKNYDSLEGLPEWARRQIEKGKKDKRAYSYTPVELEKARTHDIYWNCAQKELLITGRMHNYMRMYWGKKIIEWTSHPSLALKTMIHLNDTYAMDGRDPNGYASILWCFGLHDRPFFPRPVFGLVRYMSSRGLQSKFDMKEYVQKISHLEKTASKNSEDFVF